MSRKTKVGHLKNRVGVAFTKDEIPQFFDALSLERNKSIQASPVISYEQELRAQTVLSLLAVTPDERVLDIGCGNARDIVRIAEQGGEVFGVDISAGMIAAARQELERIGMDSITLQVGDATSLDFPDASFDKVLCSEVIEHIPDASRALRELWRVLRPRGRLVLSTPNKASWYGLERYWVWEGLLRRKWPHPCDEWRNMTEVIALLEQNGFRVSEQRSVCFVPGFIVTYFLLPRIFQDLLVRVIGKLEPQLQRWFQNRGYTVCVMAMRDAE